MFRLLKEVYRVRKNISSQSPVPTSMHLNITGKCPCKCWHCEKADDSGGRHVPIISIEKFQVLASQWKCPVLYSGGEPLIHPHWRRVLQSGSELGIDQKMITSGVGFNKLTSNDLMLISRSLTELLISLDSSDGPTHDRLRGVSGLYDQIIDYLGHAPRPVRVWIVHVPPPDWSGVRQVIKLAAELSVGLIVQPYIFSSNFPHLLPLSSSTAVKLQLPELAGRVAARVSELSKVSRDSGVVSNLEEIEQYIFDYYDCSNREAWFGSKVLPRYSCSVPWQQVTIDEFERIQPCVFLRGIPIPNDGDLYHLWRTQALAFRNEIMAGKIWPECHSCSCHFSSNFRNSVLAKPFSNRKGIGVLARKLYMKTRARIGN
ncbi:MAG: hypothetical protein DRI46_12580 [Chloroflexi bacterium]|nr:MAG: hypothetical protein DRI46_12580 [Chloroflexota bacterium]